MIDLRAFYCFAHVARERSFSRAAERIGIAQPNMSTLIGRLEKHLGGPLFIRRRQPIALTAVGQRLVPAADALAVQADLLEQQSRVIRRQAGDTVIIAGHGSTADVPERQKLIEAFLARHPGRSVHILETSHDLGMEALQTREADFLLTFRPGADAPLALPIASTPLRLVIPREHPLARLDIIPLTALDGVEILDWSLVPRPIYDTMIAPIVAAGALMRPTIENSVRANIQMAARRRLIFPILDAFRGHDVPSTMTVKPLDRSLPEARLHLLALKPPEMAAQREFWSLATHKSLDAAAQVGREY